jgi:Lrp/AsnC family transcriptional regulator
VAITAKVGLSHTPCWRRIRRLETAGIVDKRVTLLNPDALGLNVTVLTEITLRRHDEETLTAFEDAVRAIDEVVECYSISGDKDYLLKVVVESVATYERLLKTKLLHLPQVGAVSSRFALSRGKYSTKLPI